MSRFFQVLIILLLFVPHVSALAFSPPPEAPEPPLRQSWQVTFPGERGVMQVISTGGMLYLVTKEGIIHALEAASGREIWQVSCWESPLVQRCPYDPPIEPEAWEYPVYPELTGAKERIVLAGEVLVAGFCTGSTYGGTQAEILATSFDISSGDMLWTRPLGVGGVAGTAGKLVVLNTDLGIMGVEGTTGEPAWLVEKGDFAFLRASLVAEGAVFAFKRKEEWGNTSYIAYDAIDGSILWEWEEGEYYIHLLGAAGGRFFTLSGSYEQPVMLSAHDVRSGQKLWACELGWSDSVIYYTGMAFQGGTLYLGGGSSWMPAGLAAIDAATGQILWKTLAEVGGDKVALLGDTVYLLAWVNYQRRIYAVDALTGQVKWAGLESEELTLHGSDGAKLYVSAPSGPQKNDPVLTAYEPR